MNYCKNCGTEVEEGGKFCPSCGTSVDLLSQPSKIIDQMDHPKNPGPYHDPERTYQATSTKGSTNGLAIGGFVSSLAGFIIAGIPLGTVGLVLSLIGYKQVKERNQSGKGLAFAGIIIGAIDIVFGIWYIMSIY